MLNYKHVFFLQYPCLKKLYHLTCLNFIRKQHGGLDKFASEELCEESKVDDGRESDKVDIGGHVDEAEARVVDGVTAGL